MEMNKPLIRIVALVAIFCFASLCPFAQKPPAGPLTNATVVKLVRAGFKDKTVIAIIRSRPTQFSLDADELIELKRNGVSENIILAMLGQDESFVLADDDWMDDSRSTGSTGRSRQGSSDKRSGADIFGNGQSSQSQTSGRGIDGANQGETSTTGSATVRILRPPSEADGASIKLEKTPTLNNESVISLVEAGFSEGTIIKRIEDSPADFDLSNSKLALLRKRRVSEAIIAAMTIAMGDDSGTKETAPGRAKGN